MNPAHDVRSPASNVTQSSNRFLKIGEAAKLLGLSSETLRRWERAGKITFSRTPGGKRLFSETDLSSIRHLLEPAHKPIQTSTTNLNKSEKITLSISIPKIKPPNFNLAKFSVAIFVLILIAGNIFFFSQTPYSDQAVLGVETFIAPVLQESAPLGNFISKAGGFINKLKGGSFVVPIIGKTEFSTGGDLKVQGRAVFTKDVQIDKDLKVSGVAILSGLKTDLIENEGVLQSTLTIRTLPTEGVNDIVFEVGNSEKLRLKEEGTAVLQGVLNLASTTPEIQIENTGIFKITDGSNTLLKLTDSGSKGNLETAGDLTIGGNITLSGTLNSNTFTTTKLVFAGSSPSIYPSTTNSGISLNGNGTGAINIGNSGTGDVYIAGGSSDTGCTITNSNGNLNCAGTITASNDLDVRGGDITTNQTTFSLINATATTLNIGAAATAISIGASSGTTTINNAATVNSLAVTGNVNSSAGSLQTNGVTRIDNSGNLTAVTGSFAGAVNPSLDATYDFGSSSLRWANAYFSGDVTAGDVVFKNDFRLTENGNRGIYMLNPRGEIIASFDEDGNFWVKGEIREWHKN